ncbi:MAG: efflux transporter outer membrane subunit, partial [Limisphaerales bacterium]
QFLASEEARRGVLITLLSDVATTYFQLLELDQELEIASRTTNSFAESLRIFSQRVAGGTASALQSARAEAALEDAAAAVPSIRQRISATENQLCVLLGRNPGPIQRPAPLLTQLLPEIPPGLPSALLERRPDVRQAEQLLRSANAQVGESVAEFFPKIGLTALLGKVSPELSAFTLGGANAWGIAAEGTGPLFEGGRLVGQYRQSKATRKEFELQYRQTILNAFREVSDALVSRTQLVEIREHQAHEVTALESAVKLSTERYVAGRADYYEVLEAQQQLFPAELNLARTQRDQLLSVVTLYETLGGGWQAEANPNQLR